jgi:hypothetical protein
VRGTFSSGALSRTHIRIGATAVLAADRAGRVLAAVDDRLMLWDPAVTESPSSPVPGPASPCGAGSACADPDILELARLDKRILRIEPTVDGALLELADHSIVRASLIPGAPVKTVLTASSRAPLISRDGKLIVGESVNGQVVVVETATLSTWDLPSYYGSRDLVAIAPTTRRFVQSGFGQMALWTLPLAAADLRRWLDERTNAVADGEHAVSWSWQPHP